MQAGPEVRENVLVFRYADPEERVAGVRLSQEVRIPGDRLDFRRDGDGWVLELERPAVQRMEYRLELRHADGGSEQVVDPDNPLIAPGAFGAKSVLEMPEYVRPAWLDTDAQPGEQRELTLEARGLRPQVPARLWSPAGPAADAALPLLVVHDGPEYDALSSLTRFLDDAVAAGRVPPLRALLLQPVDRDETYSASATWASALVRGLVPQVEALVPSDGRRVVMGASLGGLASLHAQRRHPGVFAGLYLQSASFFTARFDEHVSGFGRWRRITRFTTEVMRPSTWPDPVPATLTCGAIEENLANNRLMAHHLSAQGYAARLVENPDVHTYVGWRDTFDPHLSDLLAEALG